jgi:methionyl-tRNA formyltransferase/LmbE family N-acetylglucosaminyl deacetylase
MFTTSTSEKPTRRVVFIGGLDDGRLAVQELLDHPRVELVGACVLHEDVGAAISGFRTFDDLLESPILQKIARIKDTIPNIVALRPDLIVVVGFSQIIPKALLELPTLGVVGFHSAPLPDRRGCSPLIWAMVDGLTETGVTMFFMGEGIDTGDIIAVERFPIEASDYSVDILRKADTATVSLLHQHLDGLLDGTAPRTKQHPEEGIYTRRRTAADGEIDWNKPAHEIVGLVRALAPPYPLAHTFGGDGVPILIEKARVAPDLKVPAPRYTHRSDPFCQRVLCVVAHPDDEVLGVGGTLATHAEAGGEVIALIMSEGETEKFSETPGCATRRDCANAAARVLGIADPVFHDFPDQRLDTIPFIQLIKAIEAAIEKYRPTVVYTHHHGDANTDHQVVFKATYAACRPMTRLGSIVQKLLTFETPSSTDQAPQVGDYFFNPAVFVDIESVWEKKRKALGCYPTEIIGGRHPRSFEYIEALARVRGGYSCYLMAEAFMPMRERLSRSAV